LGVDGTVVLIAKWSPHMDLIKAGHQPLYGMCMILITQRSKCESLTYWLIILCFNKLGETKIQDLLKRRWPFSPLRELALLSNHGLHECDDF